MLMWSELSRPTLMLAALRERCKHQDNWSEGFYVTYRLPWVGDRWYFRRLWRWKMTLKALVLLALFPRRSLWAHEWALDVAYIDGHVYATQEGTMYDWTTLAISKGWTRWWWDYFSDGS